MKKTLEQVKSGELAVEIYSTKDLQILNALLTGEPLKFNSTKSIVVFKDGQLKFQNEREVDFENLIDFFDLDIDNELIELYKKSPKEKFKLGLVSTIVGSEENLESLGLKLMTPSNELIDLYSELIKETPVFYYNGELKFDLLGKYTEQVNIIDLIK